MHLSEEIQALCSKSLMASVLSLLDFLRGSVMGEVVASWQLDSQSSSYSACGERCPFHLKSAAEGN